MTRIDYIFKKREFEYILPFTGVNLTFIKERREELEVCFTELKKKILTIDIETSCGTADLQLASELATYYFRARCLLDSQENRLSGKGYTTKTPVGMFTKPLKQGG